MSTPERPEGNPTNDAPGPRAIADGASIGNKATRQARVIVLWGAGVASLASWVALESVLHWYMGSFRPVSSEYPTADDMVRITEARIESGTLIFGATGGLVGLSLGLAGGASRRSIKAAVMAGGLGLLIGGLGEAGAARLSLGVIYKHFDQPTDDLLQTLLCHEALWVVVGMAGGLALGLGMGGDVRWLKTMFGGLLGAALATVVYEVVGAVLFSTHGTHQPLADSIEMRAFAQLLIPIGAAIGSIQGARNHDLGAGVSGQEEGGAGKAQEPRKLAVKS